MHDEMRYPAFTPADMLQSIETGAGAGPRGGGECKVRLPAGAWKNCRQTRNPHRIRQREYAAGRLSRFRRSTVAEHLRCGKVRLASSRFGAQWTPQRGPKSRLTIP